MAEDARLPLVQVLRTASETNHALALAALRISVLPARGPNIPEDPRFQLIDVLRASSETNRATALAAMKQSSTMNGTFSPAGGRPSPGPPRKIGLGPFVINERVGTITTAAWKALSEERLKDLNLVLQGIVDRVVAPDLSWDSRAIIIWERLAAFGFVFMRPEEAPPAPNWKLARATGEFRILRVDALVECSRVELGEHWYADEMVRVLRQLMDLRGFRHCV